MFSALAVGAMAPDFEYFLHPSAPVYYSHTFAGIFRFCLPCGLLVLWLFHRVLKKPMIALCPEEHQKRLMAFAGSSDLWSPQRLALALLSLLIGVLSHFAWDAISHSNGWVVVQFAWMRKEILRSQWLSISAYDLIWYGSTVLGLGLLFVAYRKWYAAAPVYPVDDALKMKPFAKIVWVATIFTVSTILGLLYTYSGTRFSLQEFPLAYLLFRMVSSSIAMMFMMVWLFSVGWGCLHPLSISSAEGSRRRVLAD